MGGAISKSGAEACWPRPSRLSRQEGSPRGGARKGTRSSPVYHGATPVMNWSAKEGARSSRHYGDEGATHPPLEPRCVWTARSGRARRDPKEISIGDARRARSAERRRAYKSTRRRGGCCLMRSRRTAQYQKRGQDNPRDPGRGGGVRRGRPSAKALGAKQEASE